MNENEAYQMNHAYSKCPHCDLYIHELLKDRTEKLIGDIKYQFDDGNGEIHATSEEIQKLRDKYIN